MATMEYDKQFDPQDVQKFPYGPAADHADGDHPSIYVYGDNAEVVLAVNVALATRRPLLVFGPAGSGKSSLAANVALTLGWRYYESVITSRTQAQDLLWTFDVVRRLSDARVPAEPGSVEELHNYIEPGVLWWAFDAESAARRGLPPGRLPVRAAADPSFQHAGSRAVVLLDEIDKADPDMPNNLLVPLGSLRFTVTETGNIVLAGEPPLVVVTSNGERDLSAAFLRRCVVLVLKAPDAPMLERIAESHFGPEHMPLYQALARRTTELSANYAERGFRPPSTAEYLDAVAACIRLDIGPDDPAYEPLGRSLLAKDEMIL